MQNGIKKEFGPFTLLFISFTAIFGSGWLFAPLFAAQIAGPNALISWVLGAVMAAVVGTTMAEVIALYPKSGGLNTIIQMTHGKLMGYLANILTLIVCVILPALEVRVILQYLGSQGTTLITADHQITLAGYAFSGSLLVLINVVNLYGVKFTARINNFSLLFKMVAPLTICIFFLVTLSQNGNLNASNLKPFFPLSWKEIFLAVSTSGIIFSFNGFNQATYFAAETKDPQKSIPFAILGSILVTAILYIFIQYVFLIALPKDLLAQGWSALKFPGDSGPFAGLAILLGLHVLLYFIYADAIISPLGTAFTYASGAPRMFYAFAENSLPFPALRKLNKVGIPTYSVVLSMFLSCVAFLFLPSLKAMISVLVAAFVINYSIAPISLLSLRKMCPEKSRPFRIPCAYLFGFLSLFFSNVMAYCCGFESLRNLLMVIAVTFTVGLLLLVRSKAAAYRAMKGPAWFIIQLIFLTGIAYMSELQWLTFFEALVLIGVTCGLVLLLSLRTHGTSQDIALFT